CAPSESTRSRNRDIMKVLLQNPSASDGLSEILIEHFPFVIGRSSRSDRSLPMFFISRQHCQFTVQGETVVLEDMQSANGTFVNGKRIATPTPICHGDQISFGPMGFRVIMEGATLESEKARLAAAANNDASTMMVPQPEK